MRVHRNRCPAMDCSGFQASCHIIIFYNKLCISEVHLLFHFQVLPYPVHIQIPFEPASAGIFEEGLTVLHALGPESGIDRRALRTRMKFSRQFLM
jgi:hypothetical protein